MVLFPSVVVGAVVVVKGIGVVVVFFSVVVSGDLVLECVLLPAS